MFFPVVGLNLGGELFVKKKRGRGTFVLYTVYIIIQIPYLQDLESLLFLTERMKEKKINFVVLFNRYKFKLSRSFRLKNNVFFF